MPIPDPSTFLGQRCSIRLKTRKVVIRKILTIDTNGVTVEEETGGMHLYPFSEIDMVSLARQPRRAPKK